VVRLVGKGSHEPDQVRVLRDREIDEPDVEVQLDGYPGKLLVKPLYLDAVLLGVLLENAPVYVMHKHDGRVERGDFYPACHSGNIYPGEVFCSELHLWG